MNLERILLMPPSELLHRVIGSWKTLILYVGIVCITAFKMISFPAWNKNLLFQFCRRFHTLSFMLWKAFILDFPTNASKPKHFSYLSVACNPDSWVIFCLFNVLVLRLKKKKKKKILLRFNLCLETTSYFSRILINHRHSTEFAL